MTMWLFPEENKRWTGLNDGAEEHFKRNPVGSLAREIIQNSLDARAGEAPVVLSFELLRIPAKEFPNSDQLSGKLQFALDTPKNHNDARTKAALEKALEALQKPTVSVLKIAEKNTLGMAGPAYDEDSPFFAYTLGDGLTGKTGGLGSFGIGKKAPVVNSKIRTTFVSTCYVDKRTHALSSLCQGLSFWVSHKVGEQRFGGVGYWGGRNGDAVSDQAELPNWLKRDSVGTNIYIIEPNINVGWDLLLASAVLINFFAAIHEGRLEVTAGTYSINKKTIGEIFTRKDVYQAIQSLDDEEHLNRFKSAQAFYRCLTDSRAISEQTQTMPPLGNFVIKLLVEDGLPKEVGFLRNGMFIMSNDLPSLRRFPNSKDFIAIVSCLSDEGNKVLREMEPPQHNAFEGSRYEPDTDKGPKLLKHLGKKIKDQLGKHIQPDYASVDNVEFLADLFGYEREKTGSGSGPVDVNPDGAIVQKLKAIIAPVPRQKSTATVETGDDGAQDEGGDEENGTDGGDGGVAPIPGTTMPNGGAGGDVARDQIKVERPVSDPRIRYLEDGSIQAFFAIDYVGEVLAKFFVSGADSDEPVAVEWTNYGKPYDNGIRLKVNGMDDRVSLKVRLSDVSNEALVISIYEI
jgi:hypothetical protein